MRRFSIGVAVSAFAILLVASGAWATNITIADTMGNGQSSGTNWYRGITTPNQLTPVNEDNEVEPNMVNTQAWDLEAVALNGQSLTLVGGWDFRNGADPGGWSQAEGRWSSGDVFLTLGATAPKYGATINWSNPAPTTSNNFGYQFALHLDFANPNTANERWTGTYSLIALSEATQLSLATVYDGIGYNNGSNPWRYLSGGTVLASGLTANFATVDPGAYRDGTASPLTTGGTHYFATFDLSSLRGAQTGLWTHFTAECGNDDLMGYSGTYTPVPEPFSMVMLGCLGAGMLAARKARRKAAK